MFRRAYFPGLILLFAAVAGSAVADPTPEELEQNRRKLEVWRKQPEQMTRLRQDLAAFLNLPAERREKIAKLDENLRQESAKRQARLWGVLTRYTEWLEELSEGERKVIKEAPDNATRLAIIRRLRDRDWMLSQPRATREAWAKLDGEARHEFVKKLRLEAREQRQQWLVAKNFWKELEGKQVLPCRLSDFSDKIQKYVTDYLMLMITDAEKQQLARSEGKWPDYPQTLVEIAGKHPPALPTSWASGLPRHVDQLPAPIRQKVTTEKKGLVGKKAILPKLKPFDNSPNFASKVVEFGAKGVKGGFEHEFWPATFNALQPPMQDFVSNKLTPAIKDIDDKRRLSENEGRWPAYPETIEELAKKYHLRPPWYILPDETKYKWELYRVSKYTRQAANDKQVP